MTTPAHARSPLPGWLPVVAAVVLVLALPLAKSWWYVGDVSEVPAAAEPDYMIQPWNLGPGRELLVGIAALVLCVLAFVALLFATYQGKLTARWWAVLIPLIAVSVMVGATWRVLSAGVIGANIGAGIMLLLGRPCCGPASALVAGLFDLPASPGATTVAAATRSSRGSRHRRRLRQRSRS